MQMTMTMTMIKEEVLEARCEFAILKQTEKQQKMTLVVGSVVLIVGSVVDYALI